MSTKLMKTVEDELEDFLIQLADDKIKEIGEPEETFEFGVKTGELACIVATLQVLNKIREIHKHR